MDMITIISVSLTLISVRTARANNIENIHVHDEWNITLDCPPDWDIVQWSGPDGIIIDVQNGQVFEEVSNIRPRNGGKGITILNTKGGVNKTFTCTGCDHNQKPNTTEFFVQVLDMSFEFGPPILTENNRINATCLADPRVIPDNITLTVGNQTIKTVSNKPSLSFGYVVRKINHLQRAACIIQYFDKIFWNEKQLTVYWKPKAELNVKPEQHVKIGKTVNFTCNIDSNPPVTTAYLINPFQSSQKMTIASENNFVYTLTNIQTQDFGHYSCETTNSVGTGRGTYILELMDNDVDSNGLLYSLITSIIIIMVVGTCISVFLLVRKYLIRCNRDRVQMDESNEPGPIGQAVYNNIYDAVSAGNNNQNQEDHNADSEFVNNAQDGAAGIQAAQEHPDLDYIELDFSSQQQRLHNTHPIRNADRTEYSEIVFL